MTALRIIAAIALAIASWWSFPPIDADYLTVSIGGAAGARAHYSSAWIGLVIAAIQGAMLSLAASTWCAARWCATWRRAPGNCWSPRR